MPSSWCLAFCWCLFPDALPFVDAFLLMRYISVSHFICPHVTLTRWRWRKLYPNYPSHIWWLAPSRTATLDKDRLRYSMKLP
jgi:hypothetical protein